MKDLLNDRRLFWIYEAFRLGKWSEWRSWNTVDTVCMPAHANVARMASPCLLLKAIESLQGLWHSFFSALLPPHHFTHTAAEAAPKPRATLRVKQAPVLRDGLLLITDYHCRCNAGMPLRWNPAKPPPQGGPTFTSCCCCCRPRCSARCQRRSARTGACC